LEIEETKSDANVLEDQMMREAELASQQQESTQPEPSNEEEEEETTDAE